MMKCSICSAEMFGAWCKNCSSGAQPNDRAYWLRVFAGRAMQGILANDTQMLAFEKFAKTMPSGVVGLTAEASVAYAVALRDAIEAHEQEGTR